MTQPNKNTKTEWKPVSFSFSVPIIRIGSWVLWKKTIHVSFRYKGDALVNQVCVGEALPYQPKSFKEELAQCERYMKKEAK